jgi:BirA family transcriptional regulator, biotin operon repressor / biotin---[acetyl-CoA-carboxylase] ligase
MHPIECRNPFYGAKTFYVPETISTMDDCRRLFEEGPVCTGTTVVAGYQSSGRARFRGRSWYSRPRESLLCTVVVRTGDLVCPLSVLPLAAGLAVAHALEHMGLEPEIKWPNDVLIAGRKVCGILCESGGPAVFVGIGVNCLQESFPPEIAARAVSLVMAGRSIEPLHLLPLILEGLHASVCGNGAWKPEIEARLYGRGKKVEFDAGIEGKPDRLNAVLKGVDDEGRIILLRDHRLHHEFFAAGELLVPEWTPI